MSNTATTAMMIALLAPMLAGMPSGERFRKGLVLAVPFAANIGGIGTPIASPPNAVAMGFLQNAGHSIGFPQWMLVAVPLMLGLLVATWGLIWLMFRPRTDGLRIEPVKQIITARGWFVVGVFFTTALLWLAEGWHGLPAAAVALIPAVAFTATGLLDRTDVNGIEWNILILIAGGISLGAGMQMTGLDRILVEVLPLAGLPHALWLIAILVTATLVLGTFMSNTAAANLLLPVGISSAMALSSGGDATAVQATMSIALAASMSMALPVSTPPNAIAYAAGEITTRDMAKVGVIVGVMGGALIVAFGRPVMRFWGVLE